MTAGPRVRAVDDRSTADRPPRDRHGSSLIGRVAGGLRSAEGRDPRALLPLQGSLVISGLRCVLAYVLVPLLVPIVGLADVLGAPLSIALSTLAIALSLTSLRRVRAAGRPRQGAYTTFIAVVVVLLIGAIVVDVRSLLA